MMHVKLHKIADALPITEADVVVVTTSDEGVIVVHPQWECGVPAQDLPGFVARLCLSDAETFGHGPFYGVYRDRRPPATPE
ncbi:MAG: hypothetical protein KGH75_14020 [Rhodospirillales bacterium]|nr:hypothetical protein [Rhodospirillales bacterium]